MNLLTQAFQNKDLVKVELAINSKASLKTMSSLELPLLANKLKRMYEIFSYGGTLSYQSTVYKFLSDEFHPYWNTLHKSGKNYVLKVESKTFNTENDQFEGCDSLWFDLHFRDEYIEAICQINRKIKFLIFGTKDTKYYRAIAPRLFERSSSESIFQILDIWRLV